MNKPKDDVHSTELRSSQGNHTPGPWRVNGHHIERSNGQSIAATIRDTWSPAHEERANARRIVACVNACDGMLTENLEGTSMDQIYRSLREERDALVAALADLAEAAEVAASSDPDMPSHRETERVFDAALEAARALLAKLS